MSQIQKLRFREISNVPMWLNCWGGTERTSGIKVFNQCALLSLWTQLGTCQSNHSNQETCEAPPINICFIAHLFSPSVSLAALIVKTLRSLLFKAWSVYLEHWYHSEAWPHLRNKICILSRYLGDAHGHQFERHWLGLAPKW